MAAEATAMTAATIEASMVTSATDATMSAVMTVTGAVTSSTGIDREQERIGR